MWGAFSKSQPLSSPTGRAAGKNRCERSNFNLIADQYGSSLENVLQDDWRWGRDHRKPPSLPLILFCFAGEPSPPARICRIPSADGLTYSERSSLAACQSNTSKICASVACELAALSGTIDGMALGSLTPFVRSVVIR